MRGNSSGLQPEILAEVDASYIFIIDDLVGFAEGEHEPFAGVDPIAVLDIQKIIRYLKERGIGILITDHNVRETLGICDHAYIINEGLVLAFGKPDEIVYNENVRRVYLGENFRL